MLPMHNPPHPGEIVKWDCLEPLGLTVTRAAQGLGVSRQALSSLVKREDCPVCRNGLAPVPSLRFYSGDLAWYADGL